MPYQVLARKWRPKNFFELLGQDSVRQTLTNALKQNRLYPVLLFTGPRGTGKTSSARIVAKNLRCKNQKDLIPCDKCEDCLFIQESRHLDVIEIDGASNNGVEAVRDLKDQVNYLPSTGKWKVYIIDEVHMLSNSAFNALLKTFEEPPEHVLFIMATTEIRKIPATVLSRAQRLDFHLLSPQSIKKQLEKICQKEGLALSEQILWIVAKQARGSLRDAQSLLDQVITFCGEDLSSDKVTQFLGLSDPEVLLTCVKSLIHRKEQDMIQVISSLKTKGTEPRLFLQNLIESLSYFLFIKKNPSNSPELAPVSQQELEQIQKEVAEISYEDLHFLFDMLLKGEREMAFCHDSQLVLEILLLRFCTAPRLESLAPLNPLFVVNSQDKNTSLKTPAGVKNHFKPKNPPEKTTFEAKKDKPSLNESLNKPSSLKPNQATKTSQEKPNSLKPNQATKTSQEKPSKGLKDVFNKKFDFLEFLKTKDPTLRGLVENLCLKQKSQNSYYFAVPDNSPYLQTKIKELSFQKSLKTLFTEFFSPQETLEFLDKPIKDFSLKQEKQQKDEAEQMNLIKNNSFVTEVKSLFGGDIYSVKKIPPKP